MRATRYELSSADPGEAATIARRIRGLLPTEADLAGTVSQVVAAVRDRGDEAVLELARRFDGDTAPEQSRVRPEALADALETLDPQVRAALELAIDNVRAVAEADLAGGGNVSISLPQGQTVALRDVAVSSAGIYAPGGRAAYPSTVVMCCVPARIAGVERLAVVTPPDETGKPHTTVLAACALCEVEEVYAIGGAQAIAALAYGTQSIEPVDVIVGPGSSWVQEAKRQVYGQVGIDAVAGPSELVVIADDRADAEAIALDLAAQAEHGPDSQVVLASPAPALIDRVKHAYEQVLERAESVSEASLALVQTVDLETAVCFSNAYAPEHLELDVDDWQPLVERVRVAGAILLGSTGATAFGDYVAGSNHVLPTGGAARFSGPLGVGTFRRRQALVSLPVEAAAALAPYAASIARAEGFPVHAESVEARAKGRQ